MQYTRSQYADFLERELRAQNDEFLIKVETPAIHLLEVDGEMFLGKFVAIRDGQMIIKMSNERGFPRKGTFLNALVLPSELRNYHNWGTMTYGDLINRQDCHCELSCIWYSDSGDPAFSLVGFRGITDEFNSRIKDSIGIIFVLGPQIPPSQMLFNLQKIVCMNDCEAANEILDFDYTDREFKAISLDNKSDISGFIIGQLGISDRITLQGPPGTGKTTSIANLCQKLVDDGKSVLVTAMTNRALLEVATKQELSKALKSGKIRKTNLTIDEYEEIPDLRLSENFTPIPGSVLLSTNFISSGHAADYVSGCGFDYVILDEASQATLPMFVAATRLGRKQLWVGDINQMPPVTLITERVIKRHGLDGIVDGFNTICSKSSIPNYSLSTTFRLNERSAKFSSLFYKHELIPNGKPFHVLPERIFHKHGGPSLLMIDMPRIYAPNELLSVVVMAVDSIYQKNPNARVAVLSCFKETIKQLQRVLLKYGVSHKGMFVETIARVQGLTTDFTIFAIPNTSLVRSLEPRLFNVATSRASVATLIICDPGTINHANDSRVKSFLLELANDPCANTYLPTSKTKLLDS